MGKRLAEDYGSDTIALRKKNSIYIGAASTLLSEGNNDKPDGIQFISFHYF